MSVYIFTGTIIVPQGMSHFKRKFLCYPYSAHYNNIILWGTYTAGAGDINSNNLCGETQYPNVNGNQQNVDMTTVFEDYTTYIDNGYLLKAGSSAIGAGMLGVDCGAFGTNDPYVLSGMPPIPAIFDVEMDVGENSNNAYRP